MSNVMNFKTTYLCNANEAALGKSIQIASPVFQCYGSKSAFFGRIETLRLFEDNELVRHTLKGNGAGRVLVLDGGGSMRCALLDGKLVELAYENKWEGIIINGCIRDSFAINMIDIGIRALATHPQGSRKSGHGETNVPVNFWNICFSSEKFLYADEDGLLVSEHTLTMWDSIESSKARSASQESVEDSADSD